MRFLWGSKFLSRFVLCYGLTMKRPCRLMWILVPQLVVSDVCRSCRTCSWWVGLFGRSGSLGKVFKVIPSAFSLSWPAMLWAATTTYSCHQGLSGLPYLSLQNELEPSETSGQDEAVFVMCHLRNTQVKNIPPSQSCVEVILPGLNYLIPF